MKCSNFSQSMSYTGKWIFNHKSEVKSEFFKSESLQNAAVIVYYSGILGDFITKKKKEKSDHW